MRRSTAAGVNLGHRGTLVRPPRKTFKNKFKSFFWDKDEKTCFTRTPLNWVSIFFYYIVFLLGVFVVFYISMKIAEFIAALNSNRPQFTLGSSPIGSSPGLNFFPLDDKSNLIWLSDSRSYSRYVNFINSEFKRYKEIDSKFNTSDFGPCAAAPFGYDKKTPCIFLRINRLIMWRPKPYERGDTIPKNVPEEVKTLIESSPDLKIWVTCNGTTAKDRDHITQDFFEFQGPPGFDPSPFPYDRQEKFIDPIVALMLKDSKPNKVIYSFKCSAWSKGLDSDVACVEVPYYIE